VCVCNGCHDCQTTNTVGLHHSDGVKGQTSLREPGEPGQSWDFAIIHHHHQPRHMYNRYLHIRSKRAETAVHWR
jgi:hypothetical protein